jgi:hypothetical protein
MYLKLFGWTHKLFDYKLMIVINLFIQVLEWLAFLETVDRSDLTVIKLMKLDGTKWTKLNAARNVGPKLKIRGTKTKSMNSIYLVK